MKPEGYPYLRMTCITERGQWIIAEEREDTHYEAHPIVIDFRMITPIYWHRYKVRNPDTLQLETCVLFAFLDNSGNASELLIADTFPKFDKIIREWSDYVEEDKTGV